MALLTITFCLTFFLSTVTSAPAVSSVHVSFVSGNKATQYSHGLGGSASTPLVHYNLVANLDHSDATEQSWTHSIRRRSVANKHPIEIAERSSTGLLRQIPTTTTTVSEYKKKPRLRIPIRGKQSFIPTTTVPAPTLDESMLTNFDSSNNSPSTESSISSTKIEKDFQKNPAMTKKIMRSRVKFLESRKGIAAINSKSKNNDKSAADTTAMSEGSLLSDLSTSTADDLKTKKPKDSKAVKRSPFIAENFDTAGITFPDFDEFGGDEFGSLRNYAGSSGGSGAGSLGSHSHSHANPEALSPDGVFLPPLPTEASDYSDNDPYLGDPDTAKYAAQHPPFFAAFPHKRAVLGLNEQRVHNGLEPNILRSIRPYFAFFEAANTYSHVNDVSDFGPHHHHEDHHFERSDSPSFSPIAYSSPVSYSRVSTNFLNDVDSNVLLYAQSAETRPHHHPLTSWSIFTNK